MTSSATIGATILEVRLARAHHPFFGFIVDSSLDPACLSPHRPEPLRDEGIRTLGAEQRMAGVVSCELHGIVSKVSLT